MKKMVLLFAVMLFGITSFASGNQLSAKNDRILFEVATTVADNISSAAALAEENDYIDIGAEGGIITVGYWSDDNEYYGAYVDIDTGQPGDVSYYYNRDEGIFIIYIGPNRSDMVARMTIYVQARYGQPIITVTQAGRP